MKQLNITSKDDCREEIIFMSEDDFDALSNLHAELVEEDFDVDGVYHECKNFNLVVNSADEEDIYEDDLSSVEEVIELLNSF